MQQRVKLRYCLGTVFAVLVIALLFRHVSASSLFTVTSVSDFSLGTTTGAATSDIGGGDADVSLALGDELSDQSQISDSVARTFDNNNWLAQTFMAQHDGFLDKVSLHLDRNNSSNTDGSITIELRNTASGAPTTTVLASTTLSSASVNKNGSTNYDASFAAPALVASGTTYAIVVYRSGSGTLTADYNWYSGSANSDEYASGGRYSINQGNLHPSWSLQNSGKGDLYFMTYYRTYANSIVASAVFDSSSAASQFASLSWSELLPQGADITFEVRASANSFASTDAAPSWTSLGSLNSPADLSTFLGTTYRYFQWRAYLSGSATTTPVLHSVTVAYDRAPRATTQSVTTDEDTPLIINLGGSDPDADTISFATSTSPAHGTLSMISGTQVTYTPDANYNGNDSFVFTASDGTLTSSPATVSLTVNPVNDAPVLSSVLLTPSSPKTNDMLTATPAASDAEGDSITYTYQWIKNGADISGATSSTLDLSQPSMGDKGDLLSVRVTAYDGHGGTTSPVVATSVTVGNTAPVASSTSVVIDEDATTTIVLTASDSDNDSLSYTIDANPSRGSLGAISAGQVAYTPTQDMHGSDSFTFHASDGSDSSNSATVNITINSVTDPVVLDAIGNKTVDELSPLQFTAHASDPDASSSDIIYSLVNAPTGASINSSTGEFSWTPSEAQGPGQFTFTVRAEYAGNYDEELLTVTVNEVNEAPSAATSSVAILANATTTIAVSGTDSDLPANTLFYLVSGAPAHGTLGSFAGNAIDYAPTENYGGGDSFTYRVFDGTDYSSTTEVSLIVVNTPSATPSAGTYTSGQSIVLDAVGALEIHATADGSTPACGDGNLYTGPIAVNETKTIRAIACFSSATSSVAAFPYIINWAINASDVATLWTGGVFAPLNGTASSTGEVQAMQDTEITIGGSNSTSTVEIPAGTHITSPQGNFSGDDLGLRLVSLQNLSASAGTLIVGAMEWGIPGATLEFSNPISLSLYMGNQYNGQTFTVVRSVDGTSQWTSDGIVSPGTCVVSNGLCTFSATKASFYSATTPASSSSGDSSVSSSSGSVPSGNTPPPVMGNGSPGIGSVVPPSPSPVPAPAPTLITNPPTMAPALPPPRNFPVANSPEVPVVVPRSALNTQVAAEQPAEKIAEEASEASGTPVSPEGKTLLASFLAALGLRLNIWSLLLLLFGVFLILLYILLSGARDRD